jgi:tetratricopeptide (TPR) repeat protein
LFLAEELTKADLQSVVDEQVQEVIKAQEQQSQIDANALSLCNLYLSTGDQAKVSIDELKQNVEKASPPIQVQVFYQARALRSKCWRDAEQKSKIDRAIPIFEALIAADKENKYQQNHAQLGYALKDKEIPGYARAEKELTTAIEIRGPVTESGYAIYEFNRAICRIKKDVDFISGKKSSPGVYKVILAGLKVAERYFSDLYAQQGIMDWIKINGIEDLRAA